MPDPIEMLTSLPELISGVLVDLRLAFRKANAGLLEGLAFSSGPVFKMGDSQVQMRGRMARSEGNKILFFPAEQEERGAEFAIALPIRVEHPPEDTPWQLAMGLMVFNDKIRRQVYKAAIKALTFVGMDQIGSAPVWRVAPDEYLVVVPGGNKLRAASVDLSGADATGKAIDGPDALWEILGRLVGVLAGKYEATLGKITE